VIALVTGASRGVGRGVALALADAGATVYATGRTIATVPEADLPPSIHRFPCDHTDDRAVAKCFDEIHAAHGALDLLVNNVWGGYERMVDEGRFTWGTPFWEQPPWRWDAMMQSGVRAHYRASQLAAPPMIAEGHGLIVNISTWAAQKHIANVAYGVSKAATDKLTFDMAAELRPHGVAVVSMYPGLVRTEKVMEAAAWLDLSNSESPEFTGRAIAALAADPEVMRHSGTVLVAAQIALDYGFTDVDGKRPRPLALADL
jgi:dehydrogenase/reductase SDR family protein 1